MVKYRMNENNDLLTNLGRFHTMKLGVVRIVRNLFLDTNDVVEWYKTKIVFIMLL